MSILWLLVAVAGSVWTGWCLVGILWPAEERGLAATAAKLCISTGLGWVLSSAHYLAWRAACSHLGVAYRLTDALAAPLAAWGLWRLLRRPPAAAEALSAKPGGGTWERWLLAATALVVVACLCSAAGQTFAEPLGAWDGWAIWNLKARFLFRGGSQWTGMFSRPVWFSHPDYPLALPAGIARLWTYAGHETTLAPQLASVAWEAMVAVLLLALLAQLRGITVACLGTLLLASCDQLTIYGGSQYADVLLSFFGLAGIAALTLAGRSANHRRTALLLLSGLMAGSAAFVKNEGLVLAMALLAGVLIAGWWSRAATWKSAGLLLCGMIPPLLVVAAQKIFFAGESYLVADQPSAGAILHKLLDASRHAAILKCAAAWNLGFYWWQPHWRIAIPLPNQPQIFLLAALPLVYGFKVERRDRFAAIAAGAALALVAMAYYAVLLIMPYDLAVLLESLPRLQLHLWPCAVFLVALATEPASRGYLAAGSVAGAAAVRSSE